MHLRFLAVLFLALSLAACHGGKTAAGNEMAAAAQPIPKGRRRRS